MTLLTLDALRELFGRAKGQVPPDLESAHASAIAHIEFLLQAHFGRWQPLTTAPKPQPGATYGAKFFVGRAGMAESIGVAQYQSCLLEPDKFVLNVAGLHLRAHDDLPFTHWMAMPREPQSAISADTASATPDGETS